MGTGTEVGAEKEEGVGNNEGVVKKVGLRKFI